MGRYIAKGSTTMKSLLDVNIPTPVDGQSLTFDITSNSWVNGDDLEKLSNKNAINGYAGLNVDGDLDLGGF